MANRRIARALSFLMLIALGFAWGFVAHRQQLFPYGSIRWLAERAGRIEPKLPARADVHSKEHEGRPMVMAALRALPYVSKTTVDNPEERGILVHDPDRASPGLNFYNAVKKSRAYLMDMKGRIIHEWSYPTQGGGTWHHAELMADGSLLVVLQDASLLKIDRESRQLWTYPSRAHHDLWVGDDGTITFLSREAVPMPGIHPSKPVTDDRVVVLTADGKFLDEFSLVEIVRSSPYSFLLSSISDHVFADDVTEIDLLHANHVEVFDGRLADKNPLFQRGHLLVSMKNINSIVILHGESHEILWLWGPNNVALQHHPRLLDTGRILLFDNGTEQSRVLEIDPGSRTVVWDYSAGESFFSFWGGANQRLPNGNTLITATASGEVFEVTPSGEIVWRFANPDVDEKGRRWNIWRMTRFSRDELAFLADG